MNTSLLALLRCPRTGEQLHEAEEGWLVSESGKRYAIGAGGIPRLTPLELPPTSKAQQEHYDLVSSAYVKNLSYPHTQEYVAYLDRGLLELVPDKSLGVTAELCCGSGEAIALLGHRIQTYVGVDISCRMLEKAARISGQDDRLFVQGDVTCLPLASAAFDNVVMLGGIHHVPDRDALFREVRRILKPGGVLYFREPVSDFFLWRALRYVIYRLSPHLDHENEHPLESRETIPALKRAGLEVAHWRTRGFLGFCLFMNSDILLFNKLFQFVPGIRAVTRAFCRLDDLVLSIGGLRNAGLVVVAGVRKQACGGDARTGGGKERSE